MHNHLSILDIVPFKVNYLATLSTKLFSIFRSNVDNLMMVKSNAYEMLVEGKQEDA